MHEPGDYPHIVRRPNAWVVLTGAGTTQLTYAPQVNPAPLMVSVPGENPFIASIEIVITNGQGSDIQVSSISFGIPVGTPPSLTPTTAGIGSTVSDTVNWQVTGPAHPITDGIATYTLGPATGGTVTLAAGASVVVQIFQIQTNTTPGTCTVNIKEILGNGDIGFDAFALTTFPLGFYFNGLSATVQAKSELVPVAQVPRTTQVTLVWNASVVDVTAFTIYYSNLTGQGSTHPKVLGQWQSDPLVADTTFTVEVTASGPGGIPLTAALTTFVSVQAGDIVATNVTASGTTSLTGPTNAAQVTATGLTVNGNATVTNTLQTGPIQGTTLNLSGNATAATATVSGLATAGSLTVNGQLSALGPVSMMSAPVTLSINPPFNFTAKTDGLLLLSVPSPNQSPFGNFGSYQITVNAKGQTFISYLTGAGVNLPTGMLVFLAQSALLPVPAQGQVQIVQLTPQGGTSYPAPLSGLFIPFGTPASQSLAVESTADVRDQLLTELAQNAAEHLPEDKRDRLLALLGALKR